MQDFEKLGVFYLGKRFDSKGNRLTDELVLYSSNDLVTHALCVGMTGSGKTGLCVDLIEEAAIDGVPAIVIDPKGDLSNLLLTFPQLAASDFEPWIDPDEARRAGKEVTAFAEDEAGQWKRGLADWGEDGARIQRLRDAAEFTIYTPGSTAGLPVSVLRSFAPSAADDAEAVNDAAQAVVSGVLTLAGIDADPLKSREHILLTTILVAAWRAGETLDLPAMIARVQNPPMSRVGVIDVDSMFPPKERFAFAMALNTLIASPGFETWTTGDPLDVAAFLHAGSGKPRVSIFSIAHLDDAQRMFFVTLLLNAVLGWMRQQTGTSSLRALVYMDEIAGFFPPVANPPSKPPLLALLKQARAFGIGIVLATQNPVDLDYRGLGNIGTWWLGRLQTERDKARLLDGLESASATAIDRADLDRLLSALPARTFVMRNVHEDALELFQSRWALSYLRGPIDREGIRRLTGETRKGKGQRAEGEGNEGRAEGAKAEGTKAEGTKAEGRKAEGRKAEGTKAEGRKAEGRKAEGGTRPVLPPDVPQFFAPAAGDAITYRPVLYGAAEVRFVDAGYGVDVTRTVTLTTSIGEGAIAADWDTATRLDLAPDALEKQPCAGAGFGEVPAAATRAKNYETWSKQLIAWLSANEAIELFHSVSPDAISKPDETERDFRARLRLAGREDRDGAVDALRKKYAAKQAMLDDRLRRAQQAVERESSQATSQKLQTAISVGATLVSAFLGRKSVSLSTLGRATTAARGVGRTMKESEDIHRAEETVAAIEEQRRQLDEELAADLASLQSATDPATEPLERVTLKPKKGNVAVRLVALVWTA